MIRQLLVLAALLLAAAPAARALELEAAQRNGRPVVLARGELGERDDARLTGLIARTGRVDELWLDAVTGTARDAHRFGRAIREIGLTTRVPRGARCSAVCLDVFLGGAQRVVEEDRSVALDMPDAVRIAPLRPRLEAALRRGGESGAQEVVQLFESVEAAMSAERARYLAALKMPLRILERSIALRPDRPEWLTRSEARSLGIATAFE